MEYLLSIATQTKKDLLSGSDIKPILHAVSVLQLPSTMNRSRDMSAIQEESFIRLRGKKG